MVTSVGHVDFQFCPIGSVPPAFLVARSARYGGSRPFLVVRILVTVGKVCYVVTRLVLVEGEDTVALVHAEDEVHGFLPAVPGLAAEEYAAAWREGSNLVGHAVLYAVEDEHRTHGETAPIDSFLVNAVDLVHLRDGLLDEVQVLLATDVPGVAVRFEVAEHELGRVAHLVELVTVALVVGVLVHAVRDDHERHIARHGIGGVENHTTLLPVHFDLEILLHFVGVSLHGKHREQDTQKSFKFHVVMYLFGLISFSAAKLRFFGRIGHHE